MAELERQLEALRAGGNGAASLSQAPDAGAAAPVAAAADPSESRVEAKYAQLLSSLQDEWEREKGRLQRELAAEKDRANEAVHKAAAERKRLTDALQERISSLTKQVSGDMTGLGKRCGSGPPPPRGLRAVGPTPRSQPGEGQLPVHPAADVDLGRPLWCALRLPRACAATGSQSWRLRRLQLRPPSPPTPPRRLPG